MKRFYWVNRKCSNALSVFEKARTQLQEAIAEFQRHIDESGERITEETEAIKFARGQIEAHARTNVKITEILGG